MTEIELVDVEAAIVDDDAAREIAKAVGTRHAVARRYLLWIRRRHPEATPAEVVQLIERHYAASITAAGAVITAGAMAADIGLSVVVGAATGGRGEETVKKTARQAAAFAAKNVGLGVAKIAGRRAVDLLPAGDAQLQFELTAIFGLAIADIHGMELDKSQAHALVYGLTNGRVSQQQIATMASDVAKASGGVVDVGHRIAAGRDDWSHWTTTLADALPGDAAKSLIQTIQTGHLDDARQNLSGGQRTAIEYGVGALVGGVTRFKFGRDVVLSARTAFPDAPDAFPEHLRVPVKGKAAPDADAEPNRALAALEEAAKSTGTWFAGTAGAVGGGVVTGAAALGTGAAAVGTGVASAAGAVGGKVSGLLKGRKRGTETPALTALEPDAD